MYRYGMVQSVRNLFGPIPIIIIIVLLILSHVPCPRFEASLAPDAISDTNHHHNLSRLHDNEDSYKDREPWAEKVTTVTMIVTPGPKK